MADESGEKKGSLVVVGTGVRIVGQLTVETIAQIEVADILLYLGCDPLTEEIIQGLKPGKTEGFYWYYEDGKPRADTYEQMIERTLECVRAGLRTCVAFYGHPGVFVLPGREAIRQARAEGYEARMLASVSAEDCLFADLGIDPGASGCQSYEATDFTINNRVVDPSSVLILWQAGLLGESTYRQYSYSQAAVPVLVERLLLFYPPDHPCHIYAATTQLRGAFEDRIVPICDLPTAELKPISTLCLEPAKPTQTDAALLKRVRDLIAADPGRDQP
jgi:uncharacterized protein YabN with tetrapyrrole methylase and pyrophosphatase domain